MRKLIIILLIVSLSSCGLFRRVKKDKTLEKIETRHQIKKDSIGIRIDKGTIEVKEQADTVVITKKKTTTEKTAFNIDSLVNGLTAMSNDMVDVKVILDDAGMLVTTTTLKPQPVEFKYNRTTLIQKDITEKSTKNEAVLNTEKKETKKVVKSKEPAKMGIWLIAAIVGIGIIITAIYFYFKKR